MWPQAAVLHNFSNEIYAVMVLVVALTSVAPAVMKWFYARDGFILNRSDQERVGRV